MPYRLAPEATTLCLPVKLLLILFPLPEVQEKKSREIQILINSCMFT